MFEKDVAAHTLGELLASAFIHGTRLASLLKSRRAAHATQSAVEVLEERLGAECTILASDLAAVAGGQAPNELIRLTESTDLGEFVRLYVNAKRAELGIADATFEQYLAGIVRIHLPDDLAGTVVETIRTHLDSALNDILNDRRLKELLLLDDTTVAARVQIAQLERIATIAEFWSKHQPTDETQIKAMLERHRAQTHISSSTITPPDFSERRKISLEEIYVVPFFSGFVRNPEDMLQHLRSREPGSVVILGDPGAGKTTLTKYLVHALTASKPTGVTTAAIIPLRDFEKRRSETPLSVAEYLASTAADRLQVQSSPEQWDVALHRGAVAVFFDGLDELLEVPRRAEMSEIIESFVAAYPITPTVVTCRFEGYNEAALAVGQFEILRLSPFSEQQVKDYAEKWFALPGNSPDHLNSIEAASAFLTESSNATGEFRSNPLLLSLLCILYRGRGYIPENLHEVYTQCSELLFERWDSHRQIRIARFGERLRALLSNIAWWMYEDGLNEIGVSEDELIERCVVELSELKSQDPDAAKAIATDFVEHCKGRAWIFSDAGMSDNRERRFCFTHRSFMEYFAARYVAAQLQDDPEWSDFDSLVVARSGLLVATLALQILGPRGDRVLRGFVSRTSEMNYADQDDVHEFLVQVLRSVDVHDQITQAICDSVLTDLFEEGIAVLDVRELALESHPDEAISAAAEFVASVAGARLENRPAVTSALKNCLHQYLPSTDWGSWEAFPYLVFRQARRQVRAGGPEEGLLAEAIGEAEGVLSALLQAATTFQDVFVDLVLLRVFEVGVLAERWQAELMAYVISGDNECSLSLATQALLVNRSVSQHAQQGFRILEECFAGTAEIAVPAHVAESALLEVFDAPYPVDVTCLEQESFSFEWTSTEVRLQVLAALAAVVPLVDVAPEIRAIVFASLIASTAGGDPENAYLQALEPGFDAWREVSRSGESASSQAVSFAARVRLSR